MTHPLPTSCDVLVVGGGPAGVTAAISAKESGAANVILLEKSPRLGGAVTWAMHRSICGLYADEPTTPADTLNPGLQRRIISHMMHLAPTQVRPLRMGKAWVLEFPTPAWETTLHQFCQDASVEVHLETSVTAVERDNTHMKRVRVQGQAESWLTPRIVIDCTGSGHVLSLAGEEVCQPVANDHSRMMGGWSLRVDQITGDSAALRLQTPYVLIQAVTAGHLPAIARLTVFHPGPGEHEGVFKLAVDPGELDQPAVMKERAETIFDYLRQHLPALAAARLIEQSPHPIPRDGRRLLGRHTITQADVLAGHTHQDPQSVKAWWPVEDWKQATGPTYAFGPIGQPYDIPPAALQSAGLDNLLAGGMNISADAAAGASLRASGICLATGDLAGRLAGSMLSS